MADSRLAPGYHRPFVLAGREARPFLPSAPSASTNPITHTASPIDTEPFFPSLPQRLGVSPVNKPFLPSPRFLRVLRASASKTPAPAVPRTSLLHRNPSP